MENTVVETTQNEPQIWSCGDICALVFLSTICLCGLILAVAWGISIIKD